jgi:hypothetical protein
MKLSITWSEEVSYQSEIEVDDEEVRRWVAEGGLEFDTFEEAVEAFVREDDAVWFEQCDITTDCTSVDERELGDVVPMIPTAVSS